MFKQLNISILSNQYENILSRFGCVVNTNKSISEYYYIELILDCNYTFPINLTPEGNPFCAESFGKV